jgi:hypothetical protein
MDMKQALLALTILCGACGGSGAGTHVVGTGATGFTAVDAYANPSLYVAGSPVALVTVESAAGACDRAGANALKANSTVVVITVTGSSGAGTVTSGTYTVDGTGASVSVSTVDASCTFSSSHTASGTVTLAESDYSAVSGSVDVTLDDGTRVTGSFSAPVCAAAGHWRLPLACVQ